MLNNLIDNALRYTPGGGAVTVRIETDAGQAVLTVEDTGPGIPEPDRELVFERFHRVLGTNVDGSGLGLAIVKEIVDQHGATISVTDGLASSDQTRLDPSRRGARFAVRFAAASGATPRA
jgi:two-component system sensor histidine kinase TctE